MPKNDGLKNKIRIYRAGPLRKPNFKTQNIHFEKSYNAGNCKKGALGFLKIQFVAKYQKNEDGYFGDIEKL